MKIFIFLSLLSAIFLTACNDAKFDRYPGTRLDSIPMQFRGVFKDPDKKSKQKNFIVIEKNYWMESVKGIKNYLSDSMVISNYKGAYYFSSMEANNRYWQILYIKPSGNDLLLYPFLFDKNIAREKNSITKYFSPKMDEDSNYIFTMNEEKLYEYTQKELIKEEAMRLKRK